VGLPGETHRALTLSSDHVMCTYEVINMRSVSVAEGRRRLAELIREAEAGRSVTILRRGRPVAVLVSAGTYGRLERAAAYLGALEISERLAAQPGVPNALEVARAAREELEERR